MRVFSSFVLIVSFIFCYINNDLLALFFGMTCKVEILFWIMFMIAFEFNSYIYLILHFS